METESAEATGPSSAQAAMHRRPFRLLDAMILVAATAAGFAMMQWISLETDGDYSWSALCEGWESFQQHRPAMYHRPAGDLKNFLLGSSITLAVLAIPLLSTWTMALIPIRLLGRRPRFRRLARQPGIMAVCAWGVATGFLGLHVVVATLARGGNVVSRLLFSYGMILIMPICVGLAVLASWMTLLVGRRWRAEPDWVDRLGRAMGTFWILSGFAAAVSIAFLGD
jgi:hypothetical protein